MILDDLVSWDEVSTPKIQIGRKRRDDGAGVMEQARRDMKCGTWPTYILIAQLLELCHSHLVCDFIGPHGSFLRHSADNSLVSGFSPRHHIK